MKHITFLLFFSITSSLFTQNIIPEDISEDQIKPWESKSLTAYEGFYKFGDSEFESDLRLFMVDSLIIGQVMQGYWEEGTEEWKWKYSNLTNIKINSEGKFTSDQTSGQFVTYKEGSETSKGLKIEIPWNSWVIDGTYEIGYKLPISPRSFRGTYPQASSKRLTIEELNKLSKSQLQIMRNEIFARYGYIFKPNGKMDTYFKKIQWYNAQHKNVTSFLTALEKYNIKQIQKVEAKKAN
ncbi:YARHG domain-containing protein [Tenacibaculum amylolyticum]|uniref:YARHG domain-containing protein n=1 Tax=Tenacibaculum amylolyticum TaxID=104269 RepID=UPI0038968270